MVGVPKTIDNDLDSTDYTFGFDTAVGVAMEAIDRLHTTGDSHHRTLVVEVMGRHAGWIALHAGMAGGATVILIPENPFDVDGVVAHCQHRFDSGTRRSSSSPRGPAQGRRPDPRRGEGRVRARPPRRHRRGAGLGDRGAHRPEAAVVLGHIQRGGTPSPFDRVLATRFGLAAVDAVHDGQSGVMVALRGTDIVRVPLTTATAQLKLVPAERYAEAEVFFG